MRGAVEAGQRRRAAESGTEGAKADMVVMRFRKDGRDDCRCSRYQTDIVELENVKTHVIS